MEMPATLTRERGQKSGQYHLWRCRSPNLSSLKKKEAPIPDIRELMCSIVSAPPRPRAQLYKAFATDLAVLRPPGAAKERGDGSCPAGYGC